jgi:neurofibromin 1
VTRGLKRSLAGVVPHSLTRGRSPLVLRRVAVASLALAYFPLTMPTAPARRPSASASHVSPTTPSSSVRQHRSADSHHAFTAMSGQPPSFYSSNTSSAAHQQKIIHILVNRLRNKVFFPVFSFPSLAHLSQLPSNSGVDLTQVETDPAVDETVRCLVELSKDSLDIIGLALTEVLDKLSKVCFLPLLLSI